MLDISVYPTAFKHKLDYKNLSNMKVAKKIQGFMLSRIDNNTFLSGRRIADKELLKHMLLLVTSLLFPSMHLFNFSEVLGKLPPFP